MIRIIAPFSVSNRLQISAFFLSILTHITGYLFKKERIMLSWFDKHAAAAILSLSLCTASPAQSASDFLPPTPGAYWEYRTVTAIGDSIISDIFHTDSLLAIVLEGGLLKYFISSSSGKQSIYYARGDTITVRLGEIIEAEFFGIALDLDLNQDIDIARFNQSVGVSWELLKLEQNVPLPDTLLSLIPSGFTVEEEAELELIIEAVRLGDESIALPIGDFETKVFASVTSLRITVYTTVPIIGRIPIPLTILDEYTIQSHYAAARGVVKRFADAYDVVISSSIADIEEYLFTIAGFITEMTAFNDPVTSVAAEDLPVPSDYRLYQNFPNPFNPSTVIPYAVPEQSRVTITVYDLLGRKIATLLDEVKAQGMHEIRFNVETLGSGVYYYRMQAGEFVSVRRFIITK